MLKNIAFGLAIISVVFLLIVFFFFPQFLGGQISYNVEYFKKVLPNLSETKFEIKYNRLPSTSPAMAQLSLNAKILEWSKIKRET